MTSNETTLNVNLNNKNTFIGRSIEDGVPVTSPLQNLEEVLAWIPKDIDDPGQMFSVANVPYKGKHYENNAIKTILCHDMKGGYIDDRFVQGHVITDNNWYNFYHWDVVDTFIYFSHHFVTIPPVGWINAAHKNGVAVLGTLITEGLAGKLRWKAILSCTGVWEKLASQLVEISYFYGFEGWLLNVENIIEEINMPSLILFVKLLSQKMKEKNRKGQIIWYDSVTEDGTLAWQNELNEKNGMYFDMCDGIFLNYFWNEENLKKSAEFAYNRKCDVYVGIDVFGRSSFGGGGFNSLVAFEILQKYGLSVAIFAPGWVKEDFGDQFFQINQERFWTTLGKKMKTPWSNNLEGKGFFTSFKTGLEQSEISEGIKQLKLNSQDIMPCLSFSDSIRISPQGLVIAEDNCVLYAVYAYVKAEYEVKLNVLSTQTGVEHNNGFPEFSLCILKKDSTDKQIVNMKAQPNQTFTYLSDVDFEIFKIISNIPTNLKALQLMICDNLIKKTPTLHSITLEQIFWCKSNIFKTNFQISCNLCFHAVSSDIEFTKVSFGTTCNTTTDPATGLTPSFPVSLPDATKKLMVQIGESYCGKFRVSKLEVPNPMYYGPNCQLVFKAEHLDRQNEIIAVSNLTINYGENLRYSML